MADKYVKLGTGGLSEVEATVTSAGAGDSGKVVALDGSGKLDSTLLPNGVGAETITMTASETLSAGDLVNFHVVTGSARVRKADASNGYRADGFVLTGITSGQSGTVYLPGQMLTGLTSLTIGATYYLAATPGGITTTIPTTAGHIAQEVGRAYSTTAISFNPDAPITRA